MVAMLIWVNGCNADMSDIVNYFVVHLLHTSRNFNHLFTRLQKLGTSHYLKRIFYFVCGSQNFLDFCLRETLELSENIEQQKYWYGKNALVTEFKMHTHTQFMNLDRIHLFGSGAAVTNNSLSLLACQTTPDSRTLPSPRGENLVISDWSLKLLLIGS